MRRFLIALLATAAVPVVASAQDMTPDQARAAVRASREGRPSGGWSGQAERAQVMQTETPQRMERGNRYERAERPAPDAGVQVQAQAQAQAQGGWRGNRGDGNGGGRGNWRGGQQAQPAPQAVQPAPPVAQPQRDFGSRRDWNRGDNNARRDFNGYNGGQRNWDRNNDGRRDWDRNGDGRPDYNRNDGGRRDWDRNNDGRRDWNRGDNNWNGNRAGNRDFRNWDRGWRNNNRYNWQGYRSSNRYAYRLPRYYAPSGWNYGYRRFSVGAYLFAGLFGENYWIDDPWQYRLPPAYWPYQWVRYYNDALLVDTRSGYVVDSIPDIFWY